MVDASAAKTNGGRQVRFVTDAACQVEVLDVVLSPNGDDSFASTATELRSLGYTSPSRKYLLWMDANLYCGMAESHIDERPGPDNASNVGDRGLVARVDEGCWGWNSGHSTEAHELVHMLGAVVPSAPSYSGGGHCTDEHDTMCYPDGAGRPMRDVCSRWHEALLDCGDDDYFSTAPPAGSYLATHWNSADNAFLARTAPKPTWPMVGVVSPGDGAATVRWAPPRFTGGQPITGYLVTAEPGGTTVGVGPTATSAVVPRLANGTSYRFTVRAYSANGAGISALAGPVTPGRLGVALLAGRGSPSDGVSDGGPATMAGLEPRWLAAAADGTTYVSDRSRVRRIAVDGTISTVAGDGTDGFTGDGGPASAARLNDTQGLAVGASGELYVADAGNDRIRRVSADGVITTVAGGGMSTAASGPATDASLPRPEGLAVDAAGSLYVSSPQSGQVRVVDPTGTMSLLASGLGSPAGLAVAGSSLYVAAPATGQVQKVDLVTREVSTFAGTGAPGFSGDGGRAAAAQLWPTSVAVNGQGVVYVGDTLNDRIRRIDTSGRIDTIAGQGTSGSFGDGGPAAAASLAQPTGLAVAPSGDVEFVEPGSRLVRSLLVLSPEVPPTTATPVEPNAPAEVVAVAGFGSAVVRWRPATNGGSPITGYRLTASPGGQSIDVPAIAETAAVGGLPYGTASTFTVSAATLVGRSAPSAPSAPVVPLIPAYVALSPARLADTRAGAPTTDGTTAGGGPVGPGASLSLQVTGRGGVPPTGVGAVVLNITATGSTTGGFLTVHPTGQQRPLASNLNFGPGQTIPNLVIAKVGAGGQVTIYNDTGSTNLIADVAGWFPAVP